MTKQSRIRRKERRFENAPVKAWLKDQSLPKLSTMQGIALKMRTKEDILAIRNTSYEYLIP